MKWILLLIGLLANASASILIKAGVSRNCVIEPCLKGLLDLLKNWPLLLGIILYGLAFIIYSISLSKLPLNIVHPTMTAGSIFLVGLASSYIFSEAFNLRLVLGYVLIISGVFTVCISK